MLQRTIVPLDGSPSAEAALEAASRFAQKSGSALVLLHVLEPRAPSQRHGERHLQSTRDALEYLESKALELRKKGIAVTCHVHEEGGSAKTIARTIAAHETEFHTDLVIMTIHGPRGLGEALSGSLPLRVASAGGAAVFFSIPSDGFLRPLAAHAKPHRLLLPLDGQTDHEACIPAASMLAELFSAEVVLLAAIPKTAIEQGGSGHSFTLLSPIGSGMSLEMSVETTAVYLEKLATSLRDHKLDARWDIVRGRPAEKIIECARPTDLIVLSTHRKLGLEASLEGSVAARIARKWNGEMLIVPIPIKKEHSNLAAK